MRSTGIFFIYKVEMETVELHYFNCSFIDLNPVEEYLRTEGWVCAFCQFPHCVEDILSSPHAVAGFPIIQKQQFGVHWDGKGEEIMIC